MQHSLAQLELGRVMADERVSGARGTGPKPQPPPRPHVARTRIARVLAKLAWRLDREAALKAWP